MWYINQVFRSVARIANIFVGEKIDIFDKKYMATHISCLGTGTSRKVGEVKLALWGQTPS